jgi:hypothetical protein
LCVFCVSRGKVIEHNCNTNCNTARVCLGPSNRPPLTHTHTHRRHHHHHHQATTTTPLLTHQQHPHPPTSQQTELFRTALKKVDVTFQNLDSSEISLTDVSHYYDSDPTKVWMDGCVCGYMYICMYVCVGVWVCVAFVRLGPHQGPSCVCVYVYVCVCKQSKTHCSCMPITDARGSLLPIPTCNDDITRWSRRCATTRRSPCPSSPTPPRPTPRYDDITRRREGGSVRCVCVYIYIYIYVCVCVCVWVVIDATTTPAAPHPHHTLTPTHPHTHTPTHTHRSARSRRRCAWTRARSCSTPSSTRGCSPRAMRARVRSPSACVTPWCALSPCLALAFFVGLHVFGWVGGWVGGCDCGWGVRSRSACVTPWRVVCLVGGWLWLSCVCGVRVCVLTD